MIILDATANIDGGFAGVSRLNPACTSNVLNDSQNREKFDHLNYGVATTGKQLRNFIWKANRKEDTQSLPIKHTKAGFLRFN